MITLQNMFEGLLDTGFDAQLDTELIPAPVEWLIGKFEAIKFKPGSSHEYRKCWVNAADYETCREQLADIIFDWRLKGTNKYKITRKKYWDLYKENADVTIVCFTGGDVHKEPYFGIGNFARGGAFEISLDSRGPMDATWDRQYEMVTIKEPSTSQKHEIHARIMPGWVNNKCHQRYYAFPGYCWESIKNALLK